LAGLFLKSNTLIDGVGFQDGGHDVISQKASSLLNVTSLAHCMCYSSIVHLDMKLQDMK